MEDTGDDYQRHEEREVPNNYRLRSEGASVYYHAETKLPGAINSLKNLITINNYKKFLGFFNFEKYRFGSL